MAYHRRALTDTAILVTTFLRDDLLARCVRSVREYYPDVPLYIGDNGYATDEKKLLCRECEATYLTMPFDVGVSGVRNRALAQMPRFRYVVVVEDDVVFEARTNLALLREVLDEVPEAGLAAGLLVRADGTEQHYEAMTRIDRECHRIEGVKTPEWRTTRAGVRFFLCDLTLNVFMVRGDVLDEVKWDEQFKACFEHSDFFLRLKYRQRDDATPEFRDDGRGPVERERPWRAAFVPDVVFGHYEQRDAPAYRNFRMRQSGFKRFGDKWRVKVGFSTFSRVNPVYFDRAGDDSMEDKTVAFIKAATTLEKMGLKWWAEAGTCLGIVREGDFIAHDLDIDLGLMSDAIPKWVTIRDAFIEQGFSLYREWTHGKQKIELSFKHGSVKVDLFFFHVKKDRAWHGAFGPDKDGRWGEHVEFLPHVFSARLFENLETREFKGVKVHLPSPPEDYLVERYGRNWRTPYPGYRYWKDCAAIDRQFFNTRRKVFIGGVWDLFHVGHVRILERAAALGTRLVVGVLTDDAAARYKAERPVVPFEQRLEIVRALACVDEAIQQNDTDPTADLKALGIKPDYLVHGDDWDRVPGVDYVTEYGGKAVFLAYTKGVSTTAIREAIRSPRAATTAPRLRGGEKVAIGVKTFLREDALFRTLAAIERNVKVPYRLYIADDSTVTSDRKAALYSDLRRDGHVVIPLPQNCGISVGRNAIVRALADEPYVLITDDDIEIADGGVVERLVSILEADASVGIVAPTLMSEGSGSFYLSENYAKGLRLEIADRILHRYAATRDYKRAGDSLYLVSDQVPNCFLARRELLRRVGWDDRIKVEYEHVDFALTMKTKTELRAAVCLDARAIHQLMPAEDFYLLTRRSGSPHYLYMKWQIDGIFNHFQ